MRLKYEYNSCKSVYIPLHNGLLQECQGNCKIKKNMIHMTENRGQIHQSCSGYWNW